MSPSRERIERAYQSMIDIATARSDAEKLVPIILRLEAELKQKEETAEVLDRIRAKASRN